MERRAHLEGGRQLLGFLPASLNELQQLLGAISGARHNGNQQLQRKSKASDYVCLILITPFHIQSIIVLSCGSTQRAAQHCNGWTGIQPTPLNSLIHMTLTLDLGGRTSDPTLGVGASSAAGRSFGSPTLPSTMQWTLVPPKPKLEIAARPPFQGVGWATTCNALETFSEHVLLVFNTNNSVGA